MNVRETTYFESEGRKHYTDVLRIASARCAEGDIDAVVAFVASEEGGDAAADAFLSDDLPKLVAATYRWEAEAWEQTEDGERQTVPIGLTADHAVALEKRGVSVVRSTMPLAEIVVLEYRDPKLSGIREALRMISGGTILIVQAVLMACDTGRISEGQRVVGFAADTAVVMRAAHTETMFFPDRGMEIEEILCKPGRLTLSRAREIESEPEE